MKYEEKTLFHFRRMGPVEPLTVSGVICEVPAVEGTEPISEENQIKEALRRVEKNYPSHQWQLVENLPAGMTAYLSDRRGRD